MRRSRNALTLYQVLREELGKTSALLRFKAGEIISSATNSLRSAVGAEVEKNPELAEKRRRHREAYEEILRRQWQKSDEGLRRAMEGKSLKERVMAATAAALKGLKEATSTNSGAMALLQHCTAAHAAEVAVEQGIDVKSVTMQVEERKTGTEVGSETVVVGYIDAPNTTEEEMMAFAEKLSNRCPVANAMREKIEWRRANVRTDASSGPSSETHAGSGESGGTEHVSQDTVPRGMPGTAYSPKKAVPRNTAKPDDCDELHIPGFGKHSKKGPEK
uniref:WGS project CAEQ00000000 data, annotated contig 1577 n=1 Tax=Trypanosoma congolense (strain IL3000) TaxID=1068625 RepID=F9W774_TRYCI|nr:unnamed protein product [Trypanosoma congolense IL3000]